MTRGRTVALLCAVAGLLGTIGLPARAQAVITPGANLLANAGAEGGSGATNSAGDPTPAGWSTTGDFTFVAYGAAGGFPDTSVSAATNGGTSFFSGGNGALSSATQRIDVSADASEIDSGTVQASLSGDLGGYSTQTDYATLSATYLTASGSAHGELSIGPVTAAQRNDETTLLPRSVSGSVPAGTRSIEVTVTATRFDGGYDDGYADNLSLSLGIGSSAPPPPPVLGRTENVTPVSGVVFVELPRGARTAQFSFTGSALVKGKSYIPLTEARSLPIGTKVDARRGTLKLTTASAKVGKIQAVTLSGGLFKLASQDRKGLTKGLATLSLVENDFPGAPSLQSCPPAGAASSGPGARAAKLSSKVLQTLKAGDSGGRFGTRGRFSAGTVRGTVWETVERCDGTLTIVRRGSVSVADFARRRTLVIHAGHRYLARAPAGKRR